MNASTRTRITLTNAIVAADKLGAEVVFTRERLIPLLESLDNDDVVLFETTQLDTGSFTVSLRDK